MTQPIQFALNRMAAPRLPFAEFVALARRLGMAAIEIRNDLAGVETLDGTPASAVGAMARDHGLAVRSINALQRFDQFDAARAAEAAALARYAAECGAQALVLCPTNSRSDARSPQARHAALVGALRGLAPILRDHGLAGLIEPLGFEECAVRRKSQAVSAIEEAGAVVGTGKDAGTGTGTGTGTEANTPRLFQLVHDTFHHHLAGEGLFFTALTGLVHVSGVDDTALSADQMRDGHRVLVGSADRLGNAGQLRRLLDEGYAGCVSFEPFAESVARLSAPELEAALRASLGHLREAVAQAEPA